MTIEEKSEISDYMNKITKEQAQELTKFCNRYNVKPEICAWYDDWEDFCSDWCDNIGYTRIEARKKLHGGEGEFKIFSNGEIVRLCI